MAEFRKFFKPQFSLLFVNKGFILSMNPQMSKVLMDQINEEGEPDFSLQYMNKIFILGINPQMGKVLMDEIKQQGEYLNLTVIVQVPLKDSRPLCNLCNRADDYFLRNLGQQIEEVLDQERGQQVAKKKEKVEEKDDSLLVQQLDEVLDKFRVKSPTKVDLPNYTLLTELPFKGAEMMRDLCNRSSNSFLRNLGKELDELLEELRDKRLAYESRRTREMDDLHDLPEEELDEDDIPYGKRL